MRVSAINVYSEVGKLKKVMVHRPGRDFDAVRPDTLERQLVDDVVWAEQAAKDHDVFAGHLRDIGAEVVYIEDLFEQSIGGEADRMAFLDEYLDKDAVFNETKREQIARYLLPLSAHDFAYAIIGGIECKDLECVEKAFDLSDVLPPLEDDPYALHCSANLVMCRDPGSSVGKGMTLNTFVQPARNLETVIWKHVFQNVESFADDDTPLWRSNLAQGTIEGGDICVLSPEVIAIGHSCRTCPEAIQEFATSVLAGDTFKKVVVFEIPKGRAWMHLDTVFTQVDVDKFTYFPGILGGLRIYELTLDAKGGLQAESKEEELGECLKRLLRLPAVDLIPCAGGDPYWAAYEQWSDGSNTLAIAPGVVVTYDRNYRTNEVLSKHDVRVLTVPSGELCRARGGPRCMSMPLVREDL